MNHLSVNNTLITSSIHGFWNDGQQSYLVNPFKPIGISRSCHLDQCTFSGLLGGIFRFVKKIIEHYVTEQRRPGPEPQHVASDLGLHCLHMSHKKVIPFSHVPGCITQVNPMSRCRRLLNIGGKQKQTCCI